MTGHPFTPDPSGGTSRIVRPGAPTPQAMMLTCARCGFITAVPAEAFEVLARRHTAGCLGPRINTILVALGIMPAPAADPADQVAPDAALPLTDAPGDDAGAPRRTQPWERQ